MPTGERFDFAAFRRAFTEKDVKAWLGFYADDARWSEYKPTAPPRAPVVMAGRAQIRAFLEAVARSPVALAISHEVVGEERAAFRVTADLGADRRIIEHVIVEVRDGRIAEQVDVEAWD